MDYLTDLPYPAHFHPEMTPVWLNATAAALGVRSPSLNAPFRYLELGCGVGLNTLTAAICHPQSTCIGIDISAREINAAEHWRATHGVGNAALHCEDLCSSAQQADAEATPDCDFIVCHGVYSWVDAGVRAAMLALIQARLKPGGIVYLGYMSEPGNAGFAAVQRLMWLHAQGLAEGSAERTTASVHWLQELARSGAGLFVALPAAARELTRLSALNKHYLAHEFFNRQWQAHHVSDVIDALDAAGCDYIGSATLIENIDAVSIPANVQPLLRQLQDRGASLQERETTKDIARNQNLRRDLYQKRASNGTTKTQPGAISDWAMDASEHRRALLALRVLLLPAARLDLLAQQGALQLTTRIGPVELATAQVQPLCTALQQRPMRYQELAQLPAYRSNPGALNALLQILVGAGWLHFAHPELSNAAQQASIAAKLLALQALAGNEGKQWLPLPQAGSALLS